MWNTSRYVIQNELERIPIIRLLDTLTGAVIFYGPEIGLRALGQAKGVNKYFVPNVTNHTSDRIISTISNYSLRKKELAKKLITIDIDKVILGIPGILVGLAAIMVIFTEPPEWNAGWLKNWAEALSATASGAVLVVDGKYLGEKWGWKKK
jgi:hypothetical protein